MDEPRIVVITVTPQLARQLQSVYDLPEVLSVPNAEPLAPVQRLPEPRPGSQVVRFLLQGRVGPGRGVARHGSAGV